jgi:hypothetical protein
MTIKPSGPLSLSELQAELGGSAPISLGEYYRGGAYTTNIAENNAVAASGAIRVGSFYNVRKFVPGSATFTSNSGFTIPLGVSTLYFSGIGGGAGAGNIVDGGRNDDYGGSGGGSSGQKVSNYPISVTGGMSIYVTIGGGGGNAYGGRDSGNQGGGGGTTQISLSDGRVYYLLGGVGGYGGVGDAGNCYGGGGQTTYNSSMPGWVTVSQGNGATGGRGGNGGAGFYGGVTGGGSYGGGNNYHYELDASDWGAGGAGTWSNYVREDNGNSPSWGGKGRQGIVVLSW